MLLHAAPSLAPSVEDVLLQNAQAVQTEEVAQTLLQMESISIERAMAMQLPLCVPVEIGQLNRCVAVTYGASPRPSAYHAPPGKEASLECLSLAPFSWLFRDAVFVRSTLKNKPVRYWL